jgi:hypothetical protein
LLLALFLPLKVIILLGAPAIPGYFPSALQSFNREYLVTSLAVLAAGFYILYLFAERSIVYSSERGAKHLLKKSRKITLFQNQDEIAVRAYQRYARSLAGAIFVGLALIVTGVFYPSLVLFIIAYVLAIFLALSLGHAFSQRVRSEMGQNLNAYGAIVGAIGFLLAFVFMVQDYLVAPPPSVIKAIVGLLLVRQLLNRLVGAVTDLNALYARHLQINALFFHRIPLLAELPLREREFWPLLESPRRNEWMNDVLREITASEAGEIECAWHQTGIADVVAFHVTCKGQLRADQYLVKLFNSNRKALAQHEASLLAGCMPGDLPALQFLGADSVGQYQCNVFKWASGKKVLRGQVRRKRLDALMRLMAIEPDERLVEQYTRSRSMLAQRLTHTMLDRLGLVAGDAETLEQVERLKGCLDYLRARLDALPVQIHNPDLKLDTILTAEGGDPIVIHWGRWTVEPLGAGWPVRGKELMLLENSMVSAQERRPALLDVAVRDLKIGALMFAFEQFYNRQHYVNALELLPSVFECTEHSDVDSGLE